METHPMILELLVLAQMSGVAVRPWVPAPRQEFPVRPFVSEPRTEVWEGSRGETVFEYTYRIGPSTEVHILDDGDDE